MVIIGAHANTRSLSILSRTCHDLHTLLARELQKRLAAEITDIVIWAAASYRTRLLDRVITIALTPGSPVAAAAHDDQLRPTLSMCLASLLSMHVIHRRAQTVKVLISHGINPRNGPRLRRFVIDRTLGVVWMEYAVRRGDLGLAKWLLHVAGAKVCQGTVSVPGRTNLTMMDVAMDRRAANRRGDNVEEMIQLLMKHIDYANRVSCCGG